MRSTNASSSNASDETPSLNVFLSIAPGVPLILQSALKRLNRRNSSVRVMAVSLSSACIRSWSSFGEYECECGGARPGARPLPRPLPCERHAELVWPPTWASCSAPSRSAASRAKPRGVMAQGRSDSEGRLGDASGGSNTLVEPPVRADGVRRDEDLRLRNSDWSRMSSGAAAAVRVGVLMCDCLKDEEERVHTASGSRRGDSRFGRGEISLLRNLVPPVPA
mmetsp:Transcript_17104/g.36700  ORF Transcript_17104/g.36700 Transcript_17104/m.36700 type:complete len:222 (-) Transcript_17104:561-1226(-)